MLTKIVAFSSQAYLKLTGRGFVPKLQQTVRYLGLFRFQQLSFLTTLCFLLIFNACQDVSSNKSRVASGPLSVQFGAYVDPLVLKWQVSQSNATRYPYDVTPSYSMYKYLELKAAGNSREDASFISLNNAYPSASVAFSRSEDATSYQLLLIYKEGLTAYERYAAIRVPKIQPTLDPSKVYQVKNADDLLKINWNRAGTYILSQDFEMPPYSWTYLAIADYNARGWKPLGESNQPFQGTLDGQGFRIKNLAINRPTEDHASLLGFIRDATIKDLKIENASVTGKNQLGIVAGLMHQGLIKDSYFSGKLVGQNFVGGAVGLVDATPDLTVSRLAGVRVSIEASGADYVGGVAGQLLGSAERLTAEGKITGARFVGGIFGSVNSASYPISKRRHLSRRQSKFGQGLRRGNDRRDGRLF